MERKDARKQREAENGASRQKMRRWKSAEKEREETEVIFWKILLKGKLKKDEMT